MNASHNGYMRKRLQPKTATKFNGIPKTATTKNPKLRDDQNGYRRCPKRLQAMSKTATAINSKSKTATLPYTKTATHFFS